MVPLPKQLTNFGFTAHWDWDTLVACILQTSLTVCSRTEICLTGFMRCEGAHVHVTPSTCLGNCWDSVHVPACVALCLVEWFPSQFLAFLCTKQYVRIYQSMRDGTGRMGGSSAAWSYKSYFEGRWAQLLWWGHLDRAGVTIIRQQSKVWRRCPMSDFSCSRGLL